MDLHEVNEIRRQFSLGNWPQFLQQVTISGIRGWTGQTVKFGFPVVAVAGENGTGKSTVLKAAACAYANKNTAKYTPALFYLDTQWDSITTGELSYTVKLGDSTRTYSIRRKSERWRPPKTMADRRVTFLDISRTVPLDATVGYAKLAKLAESEVSSNDLNEEFRGYLGHVLGKEYVRARFVRTEVAGDKYVGLLRREFGEVSQFHQGAGESSTLNFFQQLQDVPHNSLLIIDEIENSLHPKAQRRLVENLLTVARQRKLQVIVSTHSPYVLQELPDEARILIQPGSDGANIIYGASAELCMSRLDDFRVPELYVFVEDSEAAQLLRSIVLKAPEGAALLSRIDIRPAGPSDVVKVLGRLGAEGKLPYKSAGILDGDSEISSGCSLLPGDGKPPEKLVLLQLKERNWAGLAARFGIGAAILFDVLNDAVLAPDHHEWTRKIGDRVQLGATNVWQTLVREWADVCLVDEDWHRLVDFLKERLRR